MEETARCRYSEVTGATVHNSGLVICEPQPWLACTPDGLVVDEEDNITVVEIKCSIKCREDKIEVDYVKNGELKKTHEYYFQIQVQLYLCKAKMCHFFVFSTADYLLLKIPLDKPFL
jgi:hypothetical protein